MNRIEIIRATAHNKGKHYFIKLLFSETFVSIVCV